MSETVRTNKIRIRIRIRIHLCQPCLQYIENSRCHFPNFVSLLQLLRPVSHHTSCARNPPHFNCKLCVQDAQNFCFRSTRQVSFECNLAQGGGAWTTSAERCNSLVSRRRTSRIKLLSRTKNACIILCAH
jgi:hypothetical protein